MKVSIKRQSPISKGLFTQDSSSRKFFQQIEILKKHRYTMFIQNWQGTANETRCTYGQTSIDLSGVPISVEFKFILAYFFRSKVVE